ncbi:MAG: iron ABC transporter permease [Clostridia bacterium]|nr:iron ABC transporter permease [Clostridia bacterium]
MKVSFGESLRRSRQKGWYWGVVTVAILVFCTLFILYPFGRLFLQSFFEDGKFSLANYGKFFGRAAYRNVLWNTVKVSISATLLGVLLGLPMAYVSTRFNIWGKKAINACVVLSMLSPPFIGAYSWILLLGKAGYITSFFRNTFGWDIGSIYGFKGILLVFTLKLFPYVYMYTSTALQNFDSALEEASESLGVHGFARIRRVTMPIIMPTILSAALIVFMTSMADFGTPVLIGRGYKVLTVLIYEKYLSEVSTQASFASAMAVVAVVFTMAVLFLQKWILNRKSYTMSAMRPPEVVKLTTGKRILATTFVWVVALIAMLPQITIIITSFRNTNGSQFVSGFGFMNYEAIASRVGSIVNTYKFSILAIILMMILGLHLAYIIVRRRGKIANLLDTLAMFPYVIPGSVIGIGMVLAFNTKPLILTGTATIMVIAYTIRKLPFTLRSSIGTLYQIEPAIEEASISLGEPPMKTFFKTTAILMLPGMLSGAVLSFVATINELSSTIILYTGGTSTISAAIYTTLFADAYGPAAALSTILTVSTILALVIFNKISGGKNVI